MWPHVLKLQRARKHLDELKAEIDPWGKGDGYTIRVEPDPQPFEADYEVRAYILRWPTEDPFSLLIGDFLQNARAALDYIAFALGDAGAGTKGMPDKIARTAGFPIVGDTDAEGFSGRGPDLFAELAEQKIPTVAEPVRAAIERMQPYYTGGQVWSAESLWILHELARFDRHRFLHLTVVKTGDVRPDPAVWRNVKIKDIDFGYGEQVIEDEPWDEDGTPAGAVIARFIAVPADPKREMHMRFLADLELGFDIDTLPPTLDTLEHSPVDITLTLIEIRVRGVIEELARFLPTLPPSWRGPF